MGRKQMYNMEGIQEVLEGLEKYPNVYFETSTVGDKRAIEEAVKIVGEDRIVFGSDYPFGKMWADTHYTEYSYWDDIVIIRDANISGEARQKILADNISNILNIKNIKNKKIPFLVFFVLTCIH
jgi:predicted TIM-barrel fold metal-dependent hydrolase